MHTQPTPEQIAKLPKWAQDHIRHLELTIREQHAVLTAAESPVVIPDEHLKAPPFAIYQWGFKYLENRNREFYRDLRTDSVHFFLGTVERGEGKNRHNFHRTIDARIGDPGVRLNPDDPDSKRLYLSGNGRLTIRHNASNTCVIDVE